jgi:hypothetical protein
MSAPTNLLIKDDANPVVEFTLLPISGLVATWRSAIAGVPVLGQMLLEMGIETLKSGTIKVTRKLSVPVMETLGASGTSAGYVAPPKVAYTNTDLRIQYVDPRSTIGDRANLLKLATAIDQGASATTATGTLANTAAADAWKNSVLPGPLLFTNLIAPR